MMTVLSLSFFVRKKQSANSIRRKTTPPDLSLFHDFGKKQNQGSLKLRAIREVGGVNALAPTKPLDLETDKLNVVYGSNGSGKSGYMRLLKHVCGARAPGSLLGNVYETTTTSQSCSIDFMYQGKNEAVDWTPEDGTIEALADVNIFDRDCGSIYVTEDHEVTYEPPLLGFLQELVRACGVVGAALQDEIDKLVSKLPEMPSEFGGTKAAIWLRSIDAETKDEEIADNCAWTEDDQLALDAIRQRLAETDPATRARELRRIGEQLDAVIKLFTACSEKLSNSAFQDLQKLRLDAEAKRKAAMDHAKHVFEGQPLDGIGSESWMLLWEQARQYSENEAYHEHIFPNTDGDARCVLCQQRLRTDDNGENARERLNSFEEFVKGALENDAKEAEEKVNDAIDGLPEIPDEDDEDEIFDRMDITDEEDLCNRLRAAFAALRNRHSSFASERDIGKLPPFPEDDVESDLIFRKKSIEDKATGYEKDALSIDRTALTIEKTELEARKWLHDQITAIKAEVQRQLLIFFLELAKRKTNTKALSDKISELSEELITDAFKARFESELKLLGAKRLEVTIIRSKTSKGRVYHKLVLSGAAGDTKTNEVLSEGEFRIVSLAAFLADVADGNDPTDVPLVFDDPVSSLDSNYEIKFACRIVELANARQVIVFTHRLSLLAALEEACNKQGVDQSVSSLTRNAWGLGEPGEAPLPAQNPKKALNTLLNQRLDEARSVFNDEGMDRYGPLGVALCVDTRITIERLIENELLADVVKRFRRDVHTKNKIRGIAKIGPADCTFLDEMMTKYSYFLHSQPSEAPIEPLVPDDLEEDLAALKKWLDEFSDRQIPA